jgi:hypothetical protein
MKSALRIVPASRREKFQRSDEQKERAHSRSEIFSAASSQNETGSINPVSSTP